MVSLSLSEFSTVYCDPHRIREEVKKLAHELTKNFKKALSLNAKASLIAQLVKNPPETQKTPVRFLSWEDPLEKG